MIYSTDGGSEMAQDLKISDLAEITGLHPETIRKLARMGRLHGVYRLGGQWLMSPEAVDRLRKVANAERATE
ncbi:MAG: helix-turn-helix domain-containing protein [Planctomycetes bacterium]|nr:helix-turn-helix domain-containing protein [Planctomycetota bacterium]